MPVPSRYSDGTATFTNGSTTVTGTGTSWALNVKKNAFIRRPSDGALAIIASDPNVSGSEPQNLSIELHDPWPHSSTPDSPGSESYEIINWLDGADIAETVQDLFTLLKGKGTGLVTTGPPDDNEGRNNDFRYDQTTGIMYVKVAGAWEEVSVQTTFDAFGDLSANERDQYDAKSAGFTFFDEPNEEWYVKKTDTSGDWAGPFQYRGPRGGDRYDIPVDIPAKPASGVVVVRMVFTTQVVFDAGLTASRAIAGTAADSDAVFSIRKNGVEFGTLTFSAGQTGGTFAAASETTFNIDDVLTVVSPDPRDDTLADIAITVTGARNTS